MRPPGYIARDGGSDRNLASMSLRGLDIPEHFRGA